MSQFVFLRGARQLLTLRGPEGPRRGLALKELGLIEDGSVLIRDGYVVSVGSTRRLENLREARQALEIPMHGRVLLPGFIDVGLRLDLGPPRANAKPPPIAPFIQETASLLRSCLQHGTVHVKVHASAAGNSLSTEIALLRRLGRIRDSPVRLQCAWHCDTTSPTEESRKALLRLKELSGLVLEGERAEEITSVARDAGVPVELFWTGESESDLARLLGRLNPSAVLCSRLQSLPSLCAVAELQPIAVVSVGREVLQSDRQAPELRSFLDRGGALALSTGYQRNADPSFNMQMVIALAVARLRLTAEEAIIATTVNAAHAARCAAHIGTIEAGKLADLVALNIADYRDLAEQFGINHVAMALRSGAVVLNRTRWRPPAEQESSRVRPKPLRRS